MRREVALSPNQNPKVERWVQMNIKNKRKVRKNLKDGQWNSEFSSPKMVPKWRFRKDRCALVL
jgi:hypothetical protein